MYGFVSSFTPAAAPAHAAAAAATRCTARPARPATVMSTAPGRRQPRQEDAPKKNAFSAVTAAALAALAAAQVGVAPQPAQALTTEDVRQLSYEQVKGTGLASRCPEVTSSKGKIALDKNAKYRVTDMCLEPKQFLVEEEILNKRKGESKKEFVDTKLMTRATYTLTGIEGDLVFKDGSWQFFERDGIDDAATTVQLPGGERVPFLFTVKRLVAKLTGAEDGISASTEMGGGFTVPSYRTGMFLDPKGRGMAAGYDMAVALPALEADGAVGQQEIRAENDKQFQETSGSIELAVNKVDPSNNEIAGVFVSEQLSDTDMGSKPPKKLLLKGIFYAHIEPAS